MKAITYQGIRELSYEEVPEPALLDPGDAIVKVELAGICGSDLHVYNGLEKGIDPGTAMGHEFTGEIVETGKGVRNFKTGDHVISPFYSCCGSCHYCHSKLACRCEEGRLFGWVENGEGLQGAQAEYVRVPLADSTLQTVPEGIDPELGLMLGDILPTAFFCADMAGGGTRNNFAVIGCGPVGLLAIQALLLKGANKVFAFDLVNSRLKKAESFGAIPVNAGSEYEIEGYFEGTDGKGVEAVLEAVGNPGSQKLAYRLVQKGGIISVVGVHNEPGFAFSPNDLYDKNLSYRTGRCPVQNYIPEIVDHILSGYKRFGEIISHRLELDQGIVAYEAFNERREGYYKVILKP